MQADRLLRKRLSGAVAAGLAAAFWLASVVLVPAAAAGPAAAVTTPGTGTLTMCRNWLVYTSCSTYHHVAMPQRVAVGDRFTLVFGSNLKEYDFRVARIAQSGDRCTIHSTVGNNKIDIAPCRAAANPAAAR